MNVIIIYSILHKLNTEMATSWLIKIKRDRSENVIARLFIEERVYNEHFWNCCHPFIEIVDDFITRGVDGICKHLTPPFKVWNWPKVNIKKKTICQVTRAVNVTFNFPPTRQSRPRYLMVALLAYFLKQRDGSLSNAIMM